MEEDHPLLNRDLRQWRNLAATLSPDALTSVTSAGCPCSVVDVELQWLSLKSAWSGIRWKGEACSPRVPCTVLEAVLFLNSFCFSLGFQFLFVKSLIFTDFHFLFIRKWNLWGGFTPSPMSPRSCHHRMSPPMPRSWLTTPPGMGRRPSSSPAGGRQQGFCVPSARVERSQAAEGTALGNALKSQTKNLAERGAFAHFLFPSVPD